MTLSTIIHSSTNLTLGEFIGLMILHAVGGFAAVAAIASSGGWF